MKVIGKTSTGFILDASSGEVANLLGYYSEYSDGAKNVAIGFDIQVGAMYRRLYDLSHNKTTLEEISKRLRAYADLLEAVPPVVNNSIGAETVEESQ